jgi:RNA-binding protein
MNLSSSQKKYLKGLAHKLNPVVFIGQQGLSEAVLAATDQALKDHELIKVKFNEFKDKAQKQALSDELAQKAAAVKVSMIGHIVTFYRPHPDPRKRKVQLPRS